MVEHLHADQLGGGVKCRGKLHVLSAWTKVATRQSHAPTIFPGQSLTSLHAGIRSKSASGSVRAAHLTNSPNSSLQNDLEHPTAHLPFSGSGRALRFSTRLIPSIIRTAYGPVQVRVEVINWTYLPPHIPNLCQAHALQSLARGNSCCRYPQPRPACLARNRGT